MIKLTWGQVRAPEFNPILQKILKAKMPFASAKRLLEIIKEIQSEQKKSDEMWQTLKEKYLEEAEDGMLKIKEAMSEEEKATALQEFDVFGDVKIEIQKQPLTEEEMAAVELSPLDLARIDGLVQAD